MNRYLTKALSGDRKAEEQLFRILRARFLTVAKRRVREPDETEDVVQRACATVLEKYKSAEFHQGFEAWVYTVLRMKIGNYLQSKKTRAERQVDDPNNERMATKASVQPDWNLESALVECLKKMVMIRRQYARALSLTYQGYGAGEICSRLKVSRNNMYSILNRGRSMLSECLETGKV
ncbi:MAG: sigma-70 family RNA polymerase sigma factor [candidate division Zixibacteria bacterium]|nr:sigma-70 family RNA polymerase sigma factor [candidate division Zixibacteria bacterium]MDH3937415.1 sigma-70 family RNA polymerase sigma factor [candidate division Zixibacteria bacterium]MDH4035232.1 sigma-70 family RNA polymerase sigma factor [candidate division Zixibacteria bacterium]